jgi:hypothetical protein
MINVNFYGNNTVNPDILAAQMTVEEAEAVLRLARYTDVLSFTVNDSEYIVDSTELMFTEAGAIKAVNVYMNIIGGSDDEPSID